MSVSQRARRLSGDDGQLQTASADRLRRRTRLALRRRRQDPLPARFGVTTHRFRVQNDAGDARQRLPREVATGSGVDEEWNRDAVRSRLRRVQG